ncbi:isopentenyl transferase family protein [Luteipulveratus sp. YIM 133132]|uniref:Isopentenyl transferase family protein n=1 Tax=Luteipulveratus flavus TaxID=3031728 RepID=A0ABT6C2A8_9MICO|nr:MULTISPECIES: isopentenyl transferase family protein [unclassified Luteipulveratus]MDE9367071.1 isopentenyl transferase family protein [Luteipulveratus sp. YIM 133132]MDF8263056.1 isopentenyl transferase family protein [Luteipulveratus sp. YIM 133296]
MSRSGPARRVILLSGPSGAGKTRLAGRLSQQHGWPVVRLDDFYKEGDDPSLPMLEMGIADWDHLDSFDLDRAVRALEELCRTGRVEVPEYDISTSHVVGRSVVEAGSAPVVLAEGIFAAHAVRPVAGHGLLAAAYCVRQNRWVTFARRLLRDLAERRKPPLVLVRRGLRLCRLEPAIVAEQAALGATPMTPHQAEADARRCVGADS